MDWKLEIERERQVLKRILALFYALAVLTDRVCDRSYPLRCFVLWVLRPAMAIALDYIAESGSVHETLIWQRQDSIAEARRYSRCFRAAARSIKALLKALDRCEAYQDDGYAHLCRSSAFGASFGPDFARSDLLASLQGLTPASASFLRDTLVSELLLPERLDSS